MVVIVTHWLLSNTETACSYQPSQLYQPRCTTTAGRDAVHDAPSTHRHHSRQNRTTCTRYCTEAKDDQAVHSIRCERTLFAKLLSGAPAARKRLTQIWSGGDSRGGDYPRLRDVKEFRNWALSVLASLVGPARVLTSTLTDKGTCTCCGCLSWRGDILVEGRCVHAHLDAVCGVAGGDAKRCPHALTVDGLSKLWSCWWLLPCVCRHPAV